VIGRELFNQPLPGTVEMTEVLVAAMVFAVLPSIGRRRENIAVDLLDAYVPARLRGVQNLLVDLLGATAFAAIAWRVWIDAGKTAQYGGTTPYFELPLAPLLYAMSVMAALTAAGFLAAMFQPRGDRR
jgi:TRAP-type C4-dicarboxylate transport system permease small subunit